MVRENSSPRTKVAQVAQTFPLELAGDITAGGETALGTPGPFYLSQASKAAFSLALPLSWAHAVPRAELGTGGCLHAHQQEAVTLT